MDIRIRSAMTAAALDARASLGNRCVNQMRRCYDCEFPLGKKARFCPRCGARQRPGRADAIHDETLNAKTHRHR